MSMSCSIDTNLRKQHSVAPKHHCAPISSRSPCNASGNRSRSNESCDQNGNAGPARKSLTTESTKKSYTHPCSALLSVFSENRIPCTTALLRCNSNVTSMYFEWKKDPFQRVLRLKRKCWSRS
ncbi:hypothetical protein NDU88_002735 [Pleurodeles waltl]|uniref:Uncharacterized protein n=1 Tax=Pleurodeles waltl TaxID=8319 RepID=A0AAV7MP76_PLEWA|nr:hypothetical protein NDU88_002735 [Pleurodeles waltl]